MKIGVSLLTVPLDRLGGLNLRLTALIRGLAELGHEVVTIQTAQSLSESAAFYRSVRDLPVSCVAIDFRQGTGMLHWSKLPLLWLYPLSKMALHGIDLLDLRDPLVNIPNDWSFPIVFGHNHFSPFIWHQLRRCGPRLVPRLLELPFLHAMLKGYGDTVDAYIVQTEEQQQWLLTKYAIPEHAVTAIPPGFNKALIQRARDSASRDAAPSPFIAFSGRLHKWKGVFDLLEAFSLLAAQYPQWSLHFVGDGPARAEMEKDVAKLDLENRVIFWGRKSYDEALRIVSRAQAFVLPSYIETFGMSVVEAMAMGIPAIATDTCGAKDYAIEDGATGLLVPPKDPEALHRALAKLLSNRDWRNRLGSAGRERVQDLTFERMVRSTADFYTAVLEKPSAHDMARTDGPSPGGPSFSQRPHALSSVVWQHSLRTVSPISEFSSIRLLRAEQAFWAKV